MYLHRMASSMGRHIRMIHGTIILGLCMFLSARGGKPFVSKVISVPEGDMIVVLRHGKPVEARLFGIDAPDEGQPGEMDAKRYCDSLTRGLELRVMVEREPGPNRILARVLLPSGASLQQEMVQAGHAWWHRLEAPAELFLEDVEKEAREAKKGLWKHESPTPPWEYRSRFRSGRSGEPTSSYCCITCGREGTKACGDDCIPADLACERPDGCACNPKK